ncbi:probable thiopurine S-methyltransferase isoform X2 [Ostrea edulis]|uniref:probable thiopurine S-methyltransferase isoform X2 n=1 Tax=Ostrea edulis TaxID=37623 RepID=UPI0024AF5FFF|nr:probable thiopurine S-methyltransferase isoform X2 [Ostrea edulis]
MVERWWLMPSLIFAVVLYCVTCEIGSSRLLEKHIDKLINGRQRIKIFVPLCGKSVDMKWLWDQGHTIIGVESVRSAVEEFFKEQSIKYTVSDLPDIGGSVFTSEDERMKLYCCDLFKFNSKLEGGMNAVWDRGSIVAINRDERQRYAELLTSLLSPDCRYLLDTLEYDETKYPGPPFYLSEQEIHNLFGDKLSITRLDRIDIFEEAFKPWGIESLHEKLFLMTVK